VPGGRRWGALVEREFRLLFLGSAVSAVGDRVAGIALAFAVLQLTGSPSELGLVIAARQGSEAVFTIVGGVWADRLPRHRILVVAGLAQGTAQAASAALLLTGRASVVSLLALQVAYGVAGGFVQPAAIGLVPDVVSEARVQQANALLGLSQNAIGVIGPALGGLIVAAGSPAGALALDAGSFVLSALLVTRIRVARAHERATRAGFLHELREGFAAFRAQTWLWTSVVLFGLSNLVGTALYVLGPVVAIRDLGGAGGWATLLTAFSAGTIAGGLVALRLRVRRPLVGSVLAAVPLPLQMAGLALGLPLPVLAAISLVAGITLAIHLALWFTVFQQEVPAHARSRVSSFDALGSFVLLPLGSAVAGPVAAGIGVDATLLTASALGVAFLALILTIPAVWRIRSRVVAAA
jgi:hypothetical protein